MARPRRALHRAFALWLAGNKHRFAVPLRLTRRSGTVWNFVFIGVTDHLSGWINRFEITVAAEWDGGAWDLIFDLDACPKRVTGGFVCRSCELSNRTLFANREALWADHLFEPFLAWINDILAPSAWLELTGTLDTGMMARLRRQPGVSKSGSDGRCPVRYVPVRVGKSDAHADIS